MTIQKVFVLIAFVYLTGYFSHAYLLGRTVYGDGIFYYSWIRSLVIGQSVDFTDEYAHFSASQPVTETGKMGNKYSIGPAVLWSPWYVWTHALARGDGYGLPYQLVTGFSGVLYALSGLILLFRLLQKYFSNIFSLASTLCTALASNLLFYGSLDTVNSHSVSFFSSVVFLSLLFQSKKHWFLIGSVLGVIMLIRPQDAVIGILAFAYIDRKQILRFLSGALLLFIPQLAVWQILNGKFWISPYISNIEGFDFLRPHLLQVLFNSENGLFLWTPMAILGFVGFWLKQHPLPFRLMGMIFLLQLYIISSWSIWWQGASYSGRMFVATLPLLSIGFAHFLETVIGKRLRSPVVLYGIVIPLCTLNILMIFFYLLNN